MCDESFDRYERLCSEPSDQPPINLEQREDIQALSGFVVVRLKRGPGIREAGSLEDLARLEQGGAFARVLEAAEIGDARPVISGKHRKLVAELEDRVQDERFRPRHSLSAYWRLDTRHLGAEERAALVQRLRELPTIELAYEEHAVSDPVVDPTDDTYAGSQSYLDAAPTGIDARWAWMQPDSGGAGVKFIDLEQGWFPNHEDLTAHSPALIFNDNRDGVGSYKGNHGTAVLGQVVGVDNAFGIIGIVPEVASVGMTSHFDASSGTSLHVADAIVAAIAQLDPGDVLLLEVQRSSPPLPTETDPADFDAIRLAVAHGIIVVEAAGNGDNDLDAWTDGMGLAILDRASPDFQDSGAIMVGAGQAALPHDRSSFSNYGSRVDCYGWGDSIVTAGYGDLDPGTGDDTTYTSSFGGTSGASPMVTGAAILVQGMYEAATGGARLSPPQVRALLSDPATGTPQGGGTAGNIGVMPDLRAVLQTSLGIVPDVYLRDNVGDTGVVPTAGGISASPDVIVRSTAVPDPTAAFGEGSGTENSTALGHQVEAGQDNFLYVRMKNRGAAAANAVTAKVYWSEVSTLLTSDLWHLIGTTDPVDVPVGDTLVVTDALTWPQSDIPGTGHYCFVALLDHPADPAPLVPPPLDWDGFRSFVRSHNNVTWRNFNVVDVEPNDPAVLPIQIVGAPDRARRFDLEIRQRLPRGAEVEWQLPAGALAVLPRDLTRRGVIDREKDQAVLRLPLSRSLPLCAVRLPQASRIPTRLVVRLPEGAPKGTYEIALRQLHRGLEVGRVTYGLRVGGDDRG